jgi:hypothetical protein
MSCRQRGQHRIQDGPQLRPVGVLVGYELIACVRILAGGPLAGRVIGRTAGHVR